MGEVESFMTPLETQAWTYEPTCETPCYMKALQLRYQGGRRQIVVTHLHSIPEDNFPDWIVEQRIRLKQYRKRLAKWHKLCNQYHSVDPHSADDTPNPMFLTPENIATAAAHVPSLACGAAAAPFRAANSVYRGVQTVRSAANTLAQFAQFVEEAKKFFAFQGTDQEQVVENILSRIEDLSLLITMLHQSNSWTLSLAAVAQYLKTWYPKSLTKKLLVLVKRILFPETITAQAGSDLAQDLRPYNMFKEMFTAWKSFTQNDMAKNIGNVVSTLMAAGLCEKPSEVDGILKTTLFSMFKAKAWDIQKDACDFTTMVIDTAMFFLERAYSAFKHNDLTMMLYTDKEARNFDLEYALLASALPVLDCGRIHELKTHMEQNPIAGSEPFTTYGDFSARLESMLAQLAYLIKVDPDPRSKGMLNARYVTLSKVRTALLLAARSSPIRKAPLAILIYGKSSVMKSTIMQAVAKSSLAALGRKLQGSIVILNSSDPYQSEYKSQDCVVLDDVMNQKLPPHMLPKDNPSRPIIEFVNNITMSALDAAVENKGKKLITPTIFIVTTNKKDLNCHNLSIEPASLMRRFDVILDCELKAAYTAPDGGPNKPMMAQVPLGAIADAWHIWVEYVKIRREAKGVADKWSFEPVFTTGEGKDKKPEAVDIITTLKYVAKVSKRKDDEQESYITYANHCMNVDFCPHHCPPLSCRDCVLTEEQREELTRKYNTVAKEADVLKAQLDEAGEEFGLPPLMPIDDESTIHVDPESGVEGLAMAIPICSYFLLICMFARMCSVVKESIELPDDPEENLNLSTDLLGDHRLSSFTDAQQKDLWREERALMRYNLSRALWKSQYPRGDLWYEHARVPIPEVRMICSEEEADRLSLEQLYQDRKEMALKAIGLIAAGLTTTVAMYRVYVAFRNQIDAQGSEPSMPVRAEGDTDGVWKKRPQAYIPKSLSSRTATYSQLIELVRRAQYRVKITRADGKPWDKVCNAVHMRGSEWLLPSHVMPDLKAEYHVEWKNYTQGDAGLGGSTLVSAESFELIPNTDFIILRMLNAGGAHDIVKFLPEGPAKFVQGGLSVQSIFRSKNGLVEHSFPLIKYTTANNGVTFKGYDYQYPEPTFAGLCMMTIVSRTTMPTILGFHLGGKSGLSYGVAGTITIADYNATSLKLAERHPIEPHSSGDFPLEQYGKAFDLAERFPPKHSSNWLADVGNEQEPLYEVIGTHELGRVSHNTTNVRQSVISAAVSDIMFLPRYHGPPKMNPNWVHYQRELQTITYPSTGFRPKILTRALNDFWGMIDTFLDENPRELAKVHVYSIDAVIAGADGINAVNAVDISTSAGFPLNKSKKHFVRESTEPVEGITRPLIVDPIILREMDKAEDLLKNGIRCYAIHRATLKDEPVAYTKDKVRVFAGSQFHFTLLVRKYLLSVIRLIQSNWLSFECAVGINAHGTEWHTLAEHVTKFGEDRMFAGDYKSFDKNISPVITMRGFEIIHRICKKAGYTPDQLEIIRGIATEICYPVMEYDGAFLQFYGSNPSGHPLTVILNNLANSLYMRYVYYWVHDRAGSDSAWLLPGTNPNWVPPERREKPLPPPFHTRVCLNCFGDDNVGSISTEEKYFHFNTIQYVLMTVGVRYTAADKSDDAPDYIHLQDVSYLKRSFVMLDDVGKYVARLEEKSIAKSLHNYTHRKGSETLPEDIAAMSIYSALLEYFRYGRTVYDKRLRELREVAAVTSVSVPEWPTFDQLIDRYNGRCEWKCEFIEVCEIDNAFE